MTYHSAEKVVWLTIHYSASPVEIDTSAADIDRMHRERGFKGIGYHFFIRKDGTVERGRDLKESGRFEQGAHSKGENAESIGICYEGGVRKSAPNVGFDSRTPAQKRAMVKLIRDLLTLFPNAKVTGHRDMPGAATQCPGFDAAAWWDTISREGFEEVFGAYADSPKKSPVESKTLVGQTVQWGATSGLAFIAWFSALDDATKYVIGGVAGIAFLAGAVVFRERLRHWAAGIK